MEDFPKIDIGTDLKKMVEIINSKPQNDFVLINRHYLDVLLSELIKHQPRVMTLKEAFKAEVCWFEERSPYGTIVVPCAVYNYGKMLKVQCIGDMVYPEYKTDHNKIFRFWSSKPTNAQREAAPWNTD